MTARELLWSKLSPVSCQEVLNPGLLEGSVVESNGTDSVWLMCGFFCRHHAI